MVYKVATKQLENFINFLTKYYPGDQIEKNEMGGKCGTYEWEERSSKNRKREWTGLIWLRIAPSGRFF
jgi:hypothetical protein